MTQLLDAGVSPDAAVDHGLSPLHGASSYKRPKAVNLLVSRGATVNKTDNDGATPLHRAAVSNCPATILSLLEKGADKNLQNKYNRTPLDEARKRNCAEAISLLEKKIKLVLFLIDFFYRIYDLGRTDKKQLHKKK